MEEALGAAVADVLVDYTKPGVVRGHVDAALTAGLHVVVGTSGLTGEDYAEIDAAARAAGRGVIAGKPDVPSGADVAGTRVHSVRLPGYALSTDVILAGAGERLVVRHEAGASAEPYVAGTLLAIRRVPEVTGVLRGLDRLLFAQ